MSYSGRLRYSLFRGSGHKSFIGEKETKVWHDGAKKKQKLSILSNEDSKEDLFLILYLNWCFKATFSRYIISALFLFFLGIIIFALVYFVYMVVERKVIGLDESVYEYCIAVDDGNTRFARAFGLSWTTYSTVGYGHISPTMTNKCFFVSVVASFQSFVGVLYAGFCGAILFGKVSKIYSIAMVRFSEKYLIRFGASAGVDASDDDFGGDDDEDEELRNDLSNSMVATPFPILMFRIVNNLANQTYGDIMNLTVSTTASIRYNNEKNSYKDALPKKYFRPMIIMPEKVPAFSKVIYVRHHLNLASPLLNRETRHRIRENNGDWPADLNNEESLVNALQFENILVTLNGMSDISKQSVSITKKYSFADHDVGKEFVGMTKVDANGVIMVDMSKLDQVVEQD